MKELVIAGAVRTPQGKLGGALRDFTNQKLGEVVLRGLIERTHLDPQAIDEVILGCVAQQSDANNVARVSALAAGIPQRVPAFTVNRNCASGLQSIVSAAHRVLCEDAELVLAGGVEAMSALPFVNRDLRFGKKLRDSKMIDTLWEGLRDPSSGMMMGETAEALAVEFGINRIDQDAWALESHKKACSAVKEGRFKAEIVPIALSGRSQKGGLANFLDFDEGPNPNTDSKALAQLPAVFKEGGTVTAGNSCAVSDGGSAVIVATRDRAESLGLEPLARIQAWAFTGLEPERMGLGPVEATRLALRRASLDLKDIDLFEINEAFAAQYLAVERSLDLDRVRVNVSGGAIALGHPVGSTGTRIAVTLLQEMRRR